MNSAITNMTINTNSTYPLLSITNEADSEQCWQPALELSHHHHHHHHHHQTQLTFCSASPIRQTVRNVGTQRLNSAIINIIVMMITQPLSTQHPMFKLCNHHHHNYHNHHHHHHTQLTLCSASPMRQTARRVGTQRKNSAIQLARVDLGQMTRGRRGNEHPALCPRNKQSWLQTQCMSINVGVIAQLAPPATNYSPDTIHMQFSPFFLQ